MSALFDELGIDAAPAAVTAIAAGHDRPSPGLTDNEAYQGLKFRVFNRVLELLELRGISAETLEAETLREEIGRALMAISAADGIALNASERAQLMQEVSYEVVGLGPLEPLLRDASVDDINVNGPLKIYVEREGRLQRAPGRFRDTQHLMNIIQRIVSPIGRRVDEASPYVDARLADGSRVNIVIPPVALDGPLVSIRKTKPHPLRAADYVRNGSLTQDMLVFLSTAIRSRLNMLICGGTGSGKTTLLNMLSGFIPETERLVTIEDAAELQLRQSHVARLETRPANADGAREVSARDLVRNALRMRPDRIILGEVRGGEAVEMLQAMNTGHDGSMSTIHANSGRDALARIEMLLGFGGLNADPRTLRRYIASSIQVIVQAQRMANGRRRVTSIAELVGIEGDSYTLNELFRFAEAPPLSGQGEFEGGGQRPFFAARLATVPAQGATHDRVAPRIG
jgi:pilus assembly protein CpaF